MYAFGVGVTLADSHWLIGWVWPTRWRPTRSSTLLLTLIRVAYMTVAVVVAVPWAPLKLAVLVGGTYWLMTRGKTSRKQQRPLFDRLAGTVRARDASLILIMPGAATLTYWAMWSIDLSDENLRVVFFSFATLQILGGVIAYVWAATRSLRERASTVRQPTNTAGGTPVLAQESPSVVSER